MLRPKCSCGNMCKPNGNSKIDGRRLYNTYCRSCAKKMHRCKERPNRLIKGNKCSFCGFVPEHRCQLDLDHIDGNRDNYSPDNLQTLCANCHRLKTFKNKDWTISEEDKEEGPQFPLNL